MDLASFESIWVIENTKKKLCIDFPKKNFFSFMFKDEIIGYNIQSLNKMMQINKLNHPLTNEKYSSDLKNIIAERIIFMNEIGLWQNVKENITLRQKENGYMISICKSLEKQDIYIELEHLQEIRDNKNLAKLISECSMVWLDPSIASQRIPIENKVDIKFFRLSKNIIKNNLEILKEISIFVSLENIEKSENKLISYVFLTAASYVSSKINETYLQQ